MAGFVVTSVEFYIETLSRSPSLTQLPARRRCRGLAGAVDRCRRTRQMSNMEVQTEVTPLFILAREIRPVAMRWQCEPGVIAWYVHAWAHLTFGYLCGRCEVQKVNVHTKH